MEKIEKYKQELELANQILAKTKDFIQDRAETVVDKELDQNKNDVRYTISYHLANKINKVSNDMLKYDNPISLVASLRFTFESLIYSYLFLIKPKYRYQFYFSLISHHTELVTATIDRVKHEMEQLEELSNLEKEMLEEFMNNVQLEKLTPEMSAFSMKKIANEVDQKAAEQITMFFDGVENSGYSYLIHMLKGQVLAKYEKDIERLENDKQKFISKISGMDSFSLFFPEADQENLSKQLSLKRINWADEAKDVGLLKEYKLMYKLTSLFIHATSYSILTDHKFENQEIWMFYRMAAQYVKFINRNIMQLCQIQFPVSTI